MNDVNTDEIVLQLCVAESVDGIEAAFTSIMVDFNFPFFTYTSMRSIDPVRYEDIDQHTFLNTVPMDWLNHYFQQGFADDDPVINHLHEGMCVEHWQTIYENGGDLQQRCLREAEEWGLTNGIIVPLKGGTQEVYSVSAAGATEAPTPFQLVKIEAICHLFHYLHRQLMQEFKSKVELSDRQREFLQWTVDGKSLVEIAQITDITPEGVQYQMSQIYKLLGVPNLAGAVARALASGIVQPRTSARRADDT